MSSSSTPTAPRVPPWPPWARPAKPPGLAGMGVPRDGATGRTLNSCQGPFPLPQWSSPCTSPCLLVVRVSHEHGEVSVGHLVPVSSQSRSWLCDPHWWQGWDSLTHFLLQFSGPLAELCQQLLPPLSALRLMFEQQLPHPSPREASSKQIAGGGGIYLGMTGLQSIYSPCSCSLLECQIDSSSSTGCGASPPPFICKEKESLRLIAQLNMQRGKQLFGNYCLCLIMTYRSLTVINFSLELECKCEL